MIIPDTSIRDNHVDINMSQNLTRPIMCRRGFSSEEVLQMMSTYAVLKDLT